MVAKEYQCVSSDLPSTHETNYRVQCSTCPDSPTCARLLEEKWRQAYHAVFRFGNEQPNIYLNSTSLSNYYK